MSGPLEPCEDCGNLKDTPQHVLGCDSSAPVEERIDHERRVQIERALLTVREAYLGNPEAIDECADALNFLEAEVDRLLTEHSAREEALRAAFDEDDPHEALERIRLILMAPVPDSDPSSGASGEGNGPETGATLPATESAQPEEDKEGGASV